jgi:hypothetical protein
MAELVEDDLGEVGIGVENEGVENRIFEPA